MSEEMRAFIEKSPRLKAYFNGSHCLGGGDGDWLYREMSDEEWDFILENFGNVTMKCGLAMKRIELQGQKPGAWSKEISDATRARMADHCAKRHGLLEAKKRAEAARTGSKGGC